MLFVDKENLVLYLSKEDNVLYMELGDVKYFTPVHKLLNCFLVLLLLFFHIIQNHLLFNVFINDLMKLSELSANLQMTPS